MTLLTIDHSFARFSSLSETRAELARAGHGENFQMLSRSHPHEIGACVILDETAERFYNPPDEATVCILAANRFPSQISLE